MNHHSESHVEKWKSLSPCTFIDNEKKIPWLAMAKKKKNMVYSQQKNNKPEEEGHPPPLSHLSSPPVDAGPTDPTCPRVQRLPPPRRWQRKRCCLGCFLSSAGGFAGFFRQRSSPCCWDLASWLICLVPFFVDASQPLTQAPWQSTQRGASSPTSG